MKPTRTTALWAIVAIYAMARLSQLFHETIPMLLIVAMHVIPPALFCALHGISSYQRRGTAVFAGICVLVGNAFETLGVRTGFPFGNYHFTELMGPKLGYVPVFLGLAYVGMGYVSWTLGRLILGLKRRSMTGKNVFILPLTASFIMVAWDISMDPVWSTMMHAWIWMDGGAFFGVPISNFLGWFLTVYVQYQLFAFYLQGRAETSETRSPSYWRSAAAFYMISAAGNLLLLLGTAPGGATQIVDRSGVPWNVSAILGTSALMSIFLMGPISLLAWANAADR